MRLVIKERGLKLLRKNQQVACITYTDAATDELRKDLDNNPAAWISTIHAFCWSLLKDFQPALREEISNIKSWNDKIIEMDGVKKRLVQYDLGFRKYDDEKIYLHHDDIPELTALLLKRTKFCNVLTSRFPILFIDEYQDTNNLLMDSIKENLLSKKSTIIIGLFGDHWQRIYDKVCGEVNHTELPVIKKHANFRSDKAIVDCLSRMRPELKQFSNNDGDEKSEIRIYHTNSWTGVRGTGAHHGGSISDEAARDYFNQVKDTLREDGWDLSPDKTKVLLLTNSMLAKEQGYKELLDCFPYPRTDQLLRKEDDHIQFFVDVVEPACEAYQAKKYGEMFKILGSRLRIKNHAEKQRFAKDIDKLIEMRVNGNIGDVIDLLVKTKHPRLPEKILKKRNSLDALMDIPESDRDEDEQKKAKRLIDLRKIQYQQVIDFSKYVDGKTPFSTKHKVKGAEFENVLVVFSQGWMKYNFNKMLSWKTIENVPDTDKDRKFFEDNRNLFYVVCSRPRRRLTLLFTHELSVDALGTLESWFGKNTIKDIS
jgi:DNA helicase-2/ATP-dependent DNA helicase PcrA